MTSTDDRGNLHAANGRFASKPRTGAAGTLAPSPETATDVAAHIAHRSPRTAWIEALVIDGQVRTVFAYDRRGQDVGVGVDSDELGARITPTLDDPAWQEVDATGGRRTLALSVRRLVER